MKLFKKNSICGIMTLVLCTSFLGACGKGQAENSIGAVSYDYAYEQDLNIIDDNYRNYYEIFVLSYCDSNGDHIGDLGGVTQKLDYIQEMGFTGIWFMPIMPSPSYHKYDVKDYKAIDPAYGTVEDFKTLLDEAHARGIHVIIDMVINHSSTQHEWFQVASAYLQTLEVGEEPDLKECPYVDYYHFSTEKVNSTYYKLAGTNYYYEGSFWDQMPDLNLASEALRGELEDVAKFWIDLGVDGFRMDAPLHYEENDTNFNTETLNLFYEYCASLDPDFYMVSEVWAGEQTIAEYYASETPSMFNFDASSAEGKIMKAARGGSAGNFVNAMVTYQEDFGAEYAEYIDAPFITNHDQPRVANSLNSNPDYIKMAGGLLLTMNGSPFVYYGEEIGMKSDGQKDENKRLPMRWSDADSTGSTNGPQDANKNVKQNFAPLEEQLADCDSIVNYYRRALRIRNENPELARGTVEVVTDIKGSNEDRTAAITKSYEGSVIAVIYNTGLDESSVELAATSLDGMQIRGYLTLHGEEITLEDGVLHMPAQSICILK